MTGISVEKLVQRNAAFPPSLQVTGMVYDVQTGLVGLVEVVESEAAG